LINQIVKSFIPLWRLTEALPGLSLSSSSACTWPFVSHCTKVRSSWVTQRADVASLVIRRNREYAYLLEVAEQCHVRCLSPSLTLYNWTAILTPVWERCTSLSYKVCK
jgi:hypothetical protein